MLQLRLQPRRWLCGFATRACRRNCDEKIVKMREQYAPASLIKETADLELDDVYRRDLCRPFETMTRS